MTFRRMDKLCAIYDAWLDRPENATIPKEDALEVMMELVERRDGAPNEALEAQIKWLDRFIEVWDRHEKAWR